MNEQVIESFLNSLRSEKTRVTYSQGLRRIAPDLPSFLELMRSDKASAEAHILQFIYESKKTLAGGTIQTWLAALRSLHDFAEISPPLNWKKIIRAAPRKGVSQDRPVSMEEIQRIFGLSDTRGKFIISLLTSGGIRVGSFDYFRLRDFQNVEVEDLSQGHFNSKKTEIGKLTVYRGEPEQYCCFVSSEAVKLFRQYCEERTRAGEILGPDAPLIRNRLNLKTNGKRKEISLIYSSGWSISQQITYLWIKAGFGKGREFRQLHGFRKHFKTALENAGMKGLVVEKLMGHLTTLDKSYYRPTDQQLAQEYVKFQHVLFIDPAISLRTERESILKEARGAISNQDSEITILGAKVEVLTDSLAKLETLFTRIKKEQENESGASHPKT